MPTSSIDEKQIWYEKIPATISNKAPIIILHGRGWSSQSRINIGNMLAKNGHDVYIPDIPWFGKSPLTQAYTVKQYCELMYHRIQSLWLQKYILLWHSNGGRISIDIASLHQENIQHLILINSAWMPASYSIKQRIAHVLAKLGKPFINLPGMRHARALFYRLIWWHDYLRAENPLLKQTFLNMIKSDLREEMKKIQTPTTLIWWSKDSYTPLRDGKIMHTLIARSELIILEGERHGIHLQNPQLLYEKIVSVI